MSDWRDVMNARSEAHAALVSADAYGGALEDGRTGDPSLAVLLAARAIALELRALATLIDHARSDAR
jgi:hypothetical protein